MASSSMATMVADPGGESDYSSDEEVKGPSSIPVLRVGKKKYTYTIPSFPVFSVQARHIKYQMIIKGTLGVFGFIRDCPALERCYPANAVVEGYPDSFFIQVSCKCVCACLCLYGSCLLSLC